MNTFRYLRAILVAVACVGLLVPEPLCAQAPRSQSAGGRRSKPAEPSVRDVALGPGGMLRGVVFSVQAWPVPKQPVVLTSGNRELARTVSDEQGRFAFPNLRGGVYGLSAEGATHVYRVWTATAAPPQALTEVAVVKGGLVQRGQRPFSDLIFCDPIVLGVVLAAAIAIPVVIHNSRSDRTAS